MFINNIIFLIRVGPDVLDDGFDMNDEGEQLASNWHSSEIFKPTKKDTLIERIKESPLNHGDDGKKHYPSYPLLKPGAPYLVKVEDPAVNELRKDLKKEKTKRGSQFSKPSQSLVSKKGPTHIKRLLLV